MEDFVAGGFIPWKAIQQTTISAGGTIDIGRVISITDNKYNVSGRRSLSVIFIHGSLAKLISPNNFEWIESAEKQMN